MDFKYIKHGPGYMKKPPMAHECECPEDEMCPDDPCLILLRDAASAERQAIAFYLEGATVDCRLADLFLDIAEDEMHHYVETMRLIAKLDPVQRDYLEEEGLDFLVYQRAMMPKWCANWDCDHKPVMSEPEEALPPVPDKKDIKAINLLTKALADEFEAINQYQSAMMCVKDSECQDLFCHLMNEEKEHVAELTAAIFELTTEPLPDEHD